MDDLISRQAAIDIFDDTTYTKNEIRRRITELPSAQQEYEPVTAEDFAKTMSENTLYGFMAWHGEALALMKEQGFVICKKTM